MSEDTQNPLAILPNPTVSNLSRSTNAFFPKESGMTDQSSGTNDAIFAPNRGVQPDPHAGNALFQKMNELFPDVAHQEMPQLLQDLDLEVDPDVN